MADAFQNTRLSAGWNAGGAAPAKRAELETLLARIPLPSRVAELGPESERTALRILSGTDGVYRAFDVDPKRVAKLEHFFSRFPGRAFASVIAPNCALSLPDASQDLFLSCHVLEFLRMDQLYMLCSEARRILKPGGYWLLASSHPGATTLQRLFARFHSRLTGARRLELTHYVSPEDWDTVLDEKSPSLANPTQYLLLRRIAG